MKARKLSRKESGVRFGVYELEDDGGDYIDLEAIKIGANVGQKRKRRVKNKIARYSRNKNR